MMDARKCEVRSYLSQAYRLNQRIDNKLRQLEQLKNLAVHVTSTINDIKVQTSHSPSKMEDTVIKIYDQEVEINAEIDALVDLKNEIRHVIDAVENPEQRFLLEERYLAFKSFVQIAADMDYGIDNIFKLHQKALDAVVIPE